MRKVLRRNSKHHRKKEHFWVIGLNTANYVEYIELVSLGSVNMTIVNPVEVFSYAVLKKCKNLILIHNHPSGNLTPSESDKNLTKKLILGADILGIKILDHIIISEIAYYSMNDEDEL